MFEGGAYNLLSETIAGGTREVSNSVFSAAAKTAVKPVVEEFLESSFKNEILLNTSKGITYLSFSK